MARKDRRMRYYISSDPNVFKTERIRGWSHTLNNLDFLKLREVSRFEYVRYRASQMWKLFNNRLNQFLKRSK